METTADDADRRDDNALPPMIRYRALGVRPPRVESDRESLSERAKRIAASKKRKRGRR